MTPERRKEICTKYLTSHPEKRRESCHKYYEKNKDKIKIKYLAAKETQSYKMRRRNYKHTRRAREKDTDITKKWLLDLMTRTKECMICDCKLTDENRQLDHILPLFVGGAHSKDNVRFVCKKCNQTRPKDGSDEDEKARIFVRAFYNYVHASI